MTLAAVPRYRSILSAVVFSSSRLLMHSLQMDAFKLMHSLQMGTFKRAVDALETELNERTNMRFLSAIAFQAFDGDGVDDDEVESGDGDDDEA